MSQEITPLQALILWALLARGGSCPQKDLKPQPTPKDRDPLVGAGLVSVEKKNRSLILHVEDKGWHWASQNMAVELSARSNAGVFVLRDLLKRLAAFTNAKNLALAELLAPELQSSAAIETAGAERSSGAHETMAGERADPKELSARIRAAFLKLTGGSLNTRVLLRDLRAELSDIDRSTLDDALLSLARQDGADLMQLENRIEITEADNQAALFIGKEPRHILWISK